MPTPIETHNARSLANLKRNPAVALQWHAVLRPDTPASCAIRHGLLYSLKLEPIGHSIPVGVLPPDGDECRCIAIPMSRMPKPKDRDPGSFEEFFHTLSTQQQDAMLGLEFAALFRDGAITKADLPQARSGNHSGK